VLTASTIVKTMTLIIRAIGSSLLCAGG